MPIDEAEGSKARSESVSRMVLHDLKHVPFHRALKRDLRDLYRFYLDHERRERLAGMNAFSRAAYMVVWLLKSLVRNLGPARRLMLLIALLASLAGRLDLRDDRYGFASSLLPLALVTLLVVLMLELKDKLLARDELAVGRQVQLALLPRDTPQLGGWKVWMHTAPANDVGGDLVDYLQLATGGRTQLAVILGDVAGKGLGAALLMAKLQATLRALAPEAASLDSLGVRANTILCRDGLPNRFATLVFALLEENSGHVRVLNAGHLPLLLVRPTDPVRSYPASSVPLGIIPEAEFHEQALELVSGDRLVVCSDGVTEARNENDEFFGEARLLALLQSGAALDGPGLGRSVIEAVARFAGEESQSDDVSLVIIERQA